MATEVVFFRADDGAVPLLEWMDSLPSAIQIKCKQRIEALEVFGPKLRRPLADSLRDGIHELRVEYLGVHYRMLYFFYGKMAAVVSHGLSKKRKVPGGEVDKAIERKKKVKKDPDRYTFRGVE